MSNLYFDIAAHGRDSAPRTPRKSTEIQPTRNPDDPALETYERSPERQGGDARSTPATPDGPMPENERPTPD